MTNLKRPTGNKNPKTEYSVGNWAWSSPKVFNRAESKVIARCPSLLLIGDEADHLGPQRTLAHDRKCRFARMLKSPANQNAPFVSKQAIVLSPLIGSRTEGNLVFQARVAQIPSDSPSASLLRPVSEQTISSLQLA